MRNGQSSQISLCRCPEQRCRLVKPTEASLPISTNCPDGWKPLRSVLVKKVQFFPQIMQPCGGEAIAWRRARDSSSVRSYCCLRCRHVGIAFKVRQIVELAGACGL